MKSVEYMIQTGVSMVESGKYADEVARTLLPRLDVLSGADIKSLAIVGLAKRISDEMARRRRPESKQASKIQRRELGLTTETVVKLHGRLGCDCGMTAVTSLLGCIDRAVGHALRSPDRFDLEEEIGKYKKTINTPVLEKVQRSIDAAVGQSLKGIVLACSDGMKPLLNFTLADVTAWQGKAANMSRSWARRSEWFSKAGHAMRASQAKTINGLPSETLGRLAREASEVWRGSESDRNYGMVRG